MKILDSDHCVAILQGTLDLSRLAPDEELATTAINVGELAQGAAKSQRAQKNQERLDVLLAALTILAYDEWSARSFGRLKAQLEQAGEAISDADLQIACIALNQNAPMVSHNQKHFARLTRYAGFTLEDWLG